MKRPWSIGEFYMQPYYCPIDRLTYSVVTSAGIAWRSYLRGCAVFLELHRVGFKTDSVFCVSDMAGLSHDGPFEGKKKATARARSRSLQYPLVTA